MSIEENYAQENKTKEMVKAMSCREQAAAVDAIKDEFLWNELIRRCWEVEERYGRVVVITNADNLGEDVEFTKDGVAFLEHAMNIYLDRKERLRKTSEVFR